MIKYDNKEIKEIWKGETPILEYHNDGIQYWSKSDYPLYTLSGQYIDSVNSVDWTYTEEGGSPTTISISANEDNKFSHTFEKPLIKLQCSQPASVKRIYEFPDACNLTERFNTWSNLEEIRNSALSLKYTGSMASAFSGCTNLKKIDLSSVYMETPQNLGYMFYTTSNIQSIKFPDKYGAIKPSSAAYCIWSCKNLEGTLDLSSWDFTEATSLVGLVYCPKITEIKGMDLTGCFKLTNLMNLFYACNSLEKVDLKLTLENMEKVTSIAQMFSQNYKLKDPHLYLPEGEYKNVKEIQQMFHSCPFSEYVKIQFSAPQHTNLQQIFRNCTGVKILDMSNLCINSKIITNWANIFTNCPDLEKVIIGEMDLQSLIWEYSAAYYIFESCPKLTTIEGDIKNIKSSLGLDKGALNVETVLKFINALVENPPIAGSNLRIKRAVADQLTPEQKAIATSRGWSLVTVA